jgi:hypothetical protein
MGSCKVRAIYSFQFYPFLFADVHMMYLGATSNTELVVVLSYLLPSTH